MTDREAICDLIARYCLLADRAGAAELAALFCADGVLDFDGRHVGRAAVERAFARWIVEKRDPVAELRHLAYAPVVDLDGDTATAETYFDADGLAGRRRRPLRIRGAYRDRLRREGGVWRFAEHRIVLFSPLGATEGEKEP